MTTKQLIKWGLNLLEKNKKEKNIAFLVLRYLELDANSYLLNNEISKCVENNYKKAIRSYIEKNFPIALFFNYLFFYNYKFIVNKGCYQPRFETEQLVDELIHYLHSKKIIPKNIIDICCGVGPITICLKKEFINSWTLGIDINEKCILLAKQNAQNLNTKIIFKVQDFFQFKTDVLFDLIIMNPPYLSIYDYVDEGVLKNNPTNSLFAKDSGYNFYRVLASKIKKIANRDFIICLEIGSNMDKNIIELMNKEFIIIEKHVIKDYQDFNRIIIIKGRLN